MIDWLHTEIARVQGLIEAGIVLVAIVVVAATYAKTKAIVPTLGAVIFAGVVIWSVHNTGWVEGKVGEEFEGGLAPTRITLAAGR